MRMADEFRQGQQMRVMSVPHPLSIVDLHFAFGLEMASWGRERIFSPKLNRLSLTFVLTLILFSVVSGAVSFL